ncbi:hypothetical protein ACFO25_03990 [Paenactinomyces guangxiensis]|uniref:Uncharacterized protein n=1 Tax=Paenactinomyces guangxiensis TaxID=1490290 RepID=A0A7W1WUW8_9BACL|nr:hypothetical protein [Paenactinomyces guangxiensis]MBA4496509.1 hypothetical protein [Paenactinomyces guangxiensis]MBH8593644.1 hypothetical protein [Paenactinomyces guangxiensis]
MGEKALAEDESATATKGQVSGFVFYGMANLAFIPLFSIQKRSITL